MISRAFLLPMITFQELMSEYSNINLYFTAMQSYNLYKNNIERNDTMLSSSINRILEMDKEIRSNSVKLESIPKDKTVIVVVDMVNGFVHEGCCPRPGY